MNEGFGKGFYRKGNSMNRSGPFCAHPLPENLIDLLMGLL